MNTTMRKIITIRATIPMLLKCLYLLTRELEQQYGHCHQDDQEAAARLAQDAASSLRASLFTQVPGRSILGSRFGLRLLPSYF
jgi:hypothetical protein